MGKGTEMSQRDVRTQAEFDQAIKDGIDWIDIRSPAGVWIEIVKTDSATVTACGSATVTACGSATVRACGSATVRACNSATVRAYGSATVTACDSATVTACDSATVGAYNSATVTAYGSATVRACDSATVRATSLCAVHLHGATVKVTGGVVLDHASVDFSDAKAWCEYHGVEVKRGIATLFKAVNDQWTTDRGTDYSPGSKPSCDDFNDADKCGGGLHFGPTPVHAQAYFPGATKFVAVGVRVSELRPITGSTAKAKAPRVVRACVEVDIGGKEISA